MSIQFFNTLSGKTDNFDKAPGSEVGLYTCGPTVYDYAHIGNFRAFVFEDLLRRFLEFSGYKVKHVMNLTDVDDKTIDGAKKAAIRLDDYTAKYIQAFNEDLAALNCLPPASQPRATRKIKQMQELIITLIRKGVAYENAGSVYYRVSKFPGYGKLSKKKLEMNITGASERVESDEYESKEEATDFVLWKAAKEGEDKLGAAWDSPWGKGRPGWHIECSAMSIEELGEQFDIHAGGEDLIFPHHENEIAQSEGATGKDPFVKYWLHCKFLLVDGTKMSKSKGNFYTLRDLMAKGYDPMAVRLALLSTHYRNTLNFTMAGLKEAAEIVRKMDDCYWTCLNLLESHAGKEADDIFTAVRKGVPDVIWNPRSIAARLEDDLNVSALMADLQSVLTEVNKICVDKASLYKETLSACVRMFEELDRLLGFGVAEVKSIPESVKQNVLKLQESRKNKDFAAADKVRAELKSEGWLVKDGKPGEPSTVKKIRRVWDK